MRKKSQGGYILTGISILMVIGLFTSFMSVKEQFAYMDKLAGGIGILSENDLKQCKTITKLAEHVNLEIDLKCKEHRIP